MALNWRFGSNGSLYANKFLKRKGALSPTMLIMVGFL